MQETLAALLDQLVYIDNFLSNSDTPNLDVDGQLSLDLAAFVDDAFVFADEEKPDKPYLDDDDTHNPPADPDEGPSWLQNDVLGAGASRRGQPPKKNDGPGGPSNGEDEMHGAAPIGAFDDFNKGQHSPGHIDTWKDHGRNPQNHFSAYSAGDKTKNTKLGGKTHYGSAAHGPPSPPKPEQSSAPNVSIPDLSNVPKFPVPPGAELSLKQAGLSLNQIDLLSALIAQHQTSMQHVTHNYGEQQEALSLDASRLRAGQSSANINAAMHSSQYRPTPAASISNSSLEHRPSMVESPGSTNGSEFSSGTVSGHQTPTTGVSAELDKRRRSLAASARFRIKKKMKEKELEEQITQLNDLVRNFEIKIDELELENRLLKNLIIEKGNQDSDEELKLLKERAKFSNKK